MTEPAAGAPVSSPLPPISARRRHRRWLPWAALTAILAGIVALALLWSATPPDSAPGLVQISGACCSPSHGPPDVEAHSAAVDDHTVPQVMVRLLTHRGLDTPIRGGTVDLEFTVVRIDSLEDADRSEERTYRERDLHVGDTVVRGPVAIEIVAVHDAVLPRNDAVDLRVTFDRERLSEAP